MRYWLSRVFCSDIDRLKRNYDEEKYYIPDPPIKKHDMIKEELAEDDVRKNDFLVNTKINKVEVFGKDPFCRVSAKTVGNLLVDDKKNAINTYRKEAGDRLIKKFNEKTTKKDIVKNENYSEWLEKQKKEAEKKLEIEKNKGNGTIPIQVINKGKPNLNSLFDTKRFSKLQNLGNFSLGLEKLQGISKDAQPGTSTSRPIGSNNIEGGSSPTKDNKIKRAYKKGEVMPNLQNLEEKDKKLVSKNSRKQTK